MKVLIFTDSRGEHKATFKTQPIFVDRLKMFLESNHHELVIMSCPFTWTSTIDFIELIETNMININEYDKIVLYTGVVEYSPRPLSNFIQCYSPTNPRDVTIESLLDRGHSTGRIINNKQKFMEKYIPSKYIDENMNSVYECLYDGEETRSLISLNINKDIIIPYLQNLGDKLIFINSNAIVPHWDGNYVLKNPLGRPKNINIITKYSEQTIGKFQNMINLLDWTDNDVKKYTVDNMHLTYEGSEWIYEKLKTFFV